MDYLSPLTLLIVRVSDVIDGMPSVFNWCIKRGIYMGGLPVVPLRRWMGVFLFPPSPPPRPSLSSSSGSRYALWDHSFLGRLGSWPLAASPRLPCLLDCLPAETPPKGAHGRILTSFRKWLKAFISIRIPHPPSSLRGFLQAVLRVSWFFEWKLKEGRKKKPEIASSSLKVGERLKWPRVPQVVASCWVPPKHLLSGTLSPPE